MTYSGNLSENMPRAIALTHTHSHNGITMLHPGQARHVKGQHTQHQKMNIPTALPISVTTAAHKYPGRTLQSGQPVTQQHQRLTDMTRISSEGIVQPVNTGMRNKSMVPQTPTISVRQGITLSRSKGIAAPGGGIKFPNKRNATDHATMAIQKLLRPDSLSSKLEQPANTSVYSSAGRASVTAQQQALKLLERRINSAPSLVEQGIASTKINGAKYKYQKVVGGKPTVPRSMSMTLKNDVSPQIFLDRLIKSRGYCTRNYCSLEGGYYCKPTLLQKASYGLNLIQSIRQSDEVLLRKMLKCGLSPNPCNAFGESVVHMVCRRGDFKMLNIFKEAGCALQVTDDFGRTPLHDACWTAEPNFETVKMILNTDQRMLHIVDCRGSPPLSYVKRDHWGKWVAFLQSKADTYWPHRDFSKDGEEPPPALCNEAPHSRPIKDPPNAIAHDVAQLISSGKMKPDDYLAGIGSPPR